MTRSEQLTYSIKEAEKEIYLLNQSSDIERLKDTVEQESRLYTLEEYSEILNLIEKRLFSKYINLMGKIISFFNSVVTSSIKNNKDD
jgi:hypothetical protein